MLFCHFQINNWRERLIMEETVILKQELEDETGDEVVLQGSPLEDGSLNDHVDSNCPTTDMTTATPVSSSLQCVADETDNSSHKQHQQLQQYPHHNHHSHQPLQQCDSYLPYHHHHRQLSPSAVTSVAAVPLHHDQSLNPFSRGMVPLLHQHDSLVNGGHVSSPLVSSGSGEQDPIAIVTPDDLTSEEEKTRELMQRKTASDRER